MAALAILGFVRTGLFKNLFAKMKVLRFEVLPLRMLASKKVVKERLEFKEYLAGYTRQEWDITWTFCRVGTKRLKGRWWLSSWTRRAESWRR